jgi:hypothetical protein
MLRSTNAGDSSTLWIFGRKTTLAAIFIRTAGNGDFLKLMAQGRLAAKAEAAEVLRFSLPGFQGIACST